jgi:histidine triad (HIT) family protein
VPDRDCLFCRIAAGETPADVISEDELVVSFRDVSPQAPTHILLIPREHIASAAQLTEGHGQMLGRLFANAAAIAAAEGLVEHGFRLLTNAGAGAGQSVDHLHFHLLGGRAFSWPPG